MILDLLPAMREVTMETTFTALLVLQNLLVLVPVLAEARLNRRAVRSLVVLPVVGVDTFETVMGDF